ncbi:MAG TPA: SxtJ family membrane protein [Stellaceae bacterium]|nr:SxtJ family membrane protein [Stellaceae bacterium]
MAADQGTLHETLRRDEAIAGPSDRRFGFTIAAVFTVIGLLSLWRHGPHAIYWLSAAAVLAVFAAAWPAALAPLNKVWLKFGLLLHSIVSPVVLGAMFVTVFTPVGFLMRLTGKDPLRLRRDPQAASYWIPRDPPGPAPESLKHQF